MHQLTSIHQATTPLHQQTEKESTSDRRGAVRRQARTITRIEVYEALKVKKDVINQSNASA